MKSFNQPFTSTTLATNEGVLSLVYKIFFAEIITSTLIQWLDPVENIKKHLVAPRATTQEKMNLFFRGSEIYLAERYTVSELYHFFIQPQ